MREFVVVAAMKDDAIRKAALQIREELFVATLAAAKHGEAQVAARDDLGQHVEQQIETLLHGHARDDAACSGVSAETEQIQPVEQRALGRRLARQIRSG